MTTDNPTYSVAESKANDLIDEIAEHCIQARVAAAGIIAGEVEPRLIKGFANKLRDHVFDIGVLCSGLKESRRDGCNLVDDLGNAIKDSAAIASVISEAAYQHNDQTVSRAAFALEKKLDAANDRLNQWWEGK